MKALGSVSVFFLLVTLPLFSNFNNFYYQWEEYFQSQADPNTGLTAFPTLLIPTGGKREGMGTAYTAIAEDSGFIESNPSGSSVLKFTELSFLHHNWIADSNIEGVVYTVRFDDLGIGFGGKFLYLPFTSYDVWGEREAKGYFSETIATVNISYNFFSNFYFSGIAVGTNIKIAYRNVPESIYPGQSVLSAMIDLGVLTRMDFLKTYISRSKNFSIGAVVKNLGPFAIDDPLPSLATLGIAYSPMRPVTFSVDVNMPFSFDPANYPQESWNVAAGMNVVVTDFVSIQGGFQFRGDNPRVSVGSTFELEKISFTVNYNLDLSGKINPLDKFSVEAKLNLGDMGRQALQQRAEDLYLSGLEAYAIGDIAKAIKLWEMVLEVDPDFLPAQENIETATKALKLQKELEKRQELKN